MPRPVNRPLIIAHRGSSARAPENTLAAFRAALDDDADGVEFDVRLAKDGVPVVFHDADLERIAGRRQNISDLTSAELASVDVGSWFNAAFPKRARAQFAEERVPTLAAALEMLDAVRGRIYVELKCCAGEQEAIARAVSDAISRSRLLPQIVVKSFDLAAVALVRKLRPSIRTAALFEPQFRTVMRKQKHIIDAALNSGADELSLHYSLATSRLAALAASNGLPLTVWTTSDRRWLRRAGELGIIALITDDPRTFSDR